MLVDALVASINSRAYQPTDGPAYTDAQVRGIANERFTAEIVPLLAPNPGSAYLRRAQRYTIAGSAGVFLSPQRASAGANHFVRYIDPAGYLRNIPRLDDIQRANIAQQVNGPAWWTEWYFDGDRIRLQPPPPTGLPQGTLEIVYRATPNALVDLSQCLAITAVGTGPWTVTTNVDPTSVPISMGSVVDVIGGGGSHDWRAFNATITNISGAGPYVITMTNEDGTAPDATNGFTIGDYLCLANTTPYPMCADELDVLLVDSSAHYILEATHDPRASVLAEIVVQERMRIQQVVAKRSDQQPPRLINRFSPMRQQRNRLYGYRG